jgi:hypothetical protein
MDYAPADGRGAVLEFGSEILSEGPDKVRRQACRNDEADTDHHGSGNSSRLGRGLGLLCRSDGNVEGGPAQRRTRTRVEG